MVENILINFKAKGINKSSDKREY